MLELKVFSVEEANRLLPVLTETLMKLKRLRVAIEAKEAEIDAYEIILEEENEKTYLELGKLIDELNLLISGFNSRVAEIQKLGCFLKDIRLGLIDFYAVLEGKVVYLCWKGGEKEVSFWHEVGQGYAHRHPLPYSNKK